MRREILFSFSTFFPSSIKRYPEAAIFIFITSHVIINVRHSASFRRSAPASAAQHPAEIEVCPLERPSRMDGFSVMLIFFGI